MEVRLAGFGHLMIVTCGYRHYDNKDYPLTWNYYESFPEGYH